MLSESRFRKSYADQEAWIDLSVKRLFGPNIPIVERRGCIGLKEIFLPFHL